MPHLRNTHSPTLSTHLLPDHSLPRLVHRLGLAPPDLAWGSAASPRGHTPISMRTGPSERLQTLNALLDRLYVQWTVYMSTPPKLLSPLLPTKGPDRSQTWTTTPARCHLSTCQISDTPHAPSAHWAVKSILDRLCPGPDQTLKRNSTWRRRDFCLRPL